MKRTLIALAGAAMAAAATREAMSRAGVGIVDVPIATEKDNAVFPWSSQTGKQKAQWKQERRVRK